MHYNRVQTPIKIEIVGLFGRYEEEFYIVHTATIKSKNLQAPVIFSGKFNLNEVDASIRKLTPLNFKPEFSNSSLTQTFSIKISIANIHIPTFKKENYHA